MQLKLKEILCTLSLRLAKVHRMFLTFGSISTLTRFLSEVLIEKKSGIRKSWYKQWWERNRKTIWPSINGFLNCYFNRFLNQILRKYWVIFTVNSLRQFIDNIYALAKRTGKWSQVEASWTCVETCVGWPKRTRKFPRSQVHANRKMSLIFRVKPALHVNKTCCISMLHTRTLLKHGFLTNPNAV